MFNHIDTLKKDRPNLLVIHMAQDHPEMDALFDMNNSLMSTGDGISLVSKHRKAELDVLSSGEFMKLISDKKIKLITYGDLVRSPGLKAVKRP